MQIFRTSAYCGKYNCFNFVHLLSHNNVNHSKHIWAHRYIAKSHLKMDVCSRSLSPPIDEMVDSFPFVPKERRVLCTPSSFCLSKWGAASTKLGAPRTVKTRVGCEALFSPPMLCHPSREECTIQKWLPLALHMSQSNKNHASAASKKAKSSADLCFAQLRADDLKNDPQKCQKAS